MEAFDEGVLAEIYIQEGQKVGVGQRMALLLGEGEEKPSGDAPAKTAAPVSAPTATTTPASGTPAPAAVKADAPSSRVKSSPLARKIAAAKGVDLSMVTPTGPGGRIVVKDVETAATAPKAAAVPLIMATAGAGDQRLPLSGMRRVIAERLLASKTQIPHFYLNIDIDAAPLMKFRSQANAAAEASGQGKLTVNDFVLKAAIVAATRVPAVNASFAGDAIIQFADINMAVAVAVEDGLVTPVVRASQKKSIRELSEAVKDLATRARSKKLKPEEYQGGTITVSNLGAFGIDNFSAIINPPQAMILAIGAVVKKPVIGPGDTIVAGQRMSIGLSADHRVVDGAIGAQYLAELRQLLESPALMLL